MTQFEVHYLRGMLAAMLTYAKVAKRNRYHIVHVIGMYQQAWVNYNNAMQRAMRDEEYRRRAGMGEYPPLPPSE